METGRHDIPLLLAEDDEEIRELFTLFLESEGFRVAAAGHAQDALAAAREGDPLIALVDLRLPRDGTLAFLAALFTARPALRVVLVDDTGVGEETQKIYRGRLSIVRRPLRTETIRNYLDLQLDRLAVERFQERTYARAMEQPVTTRLLAAGMNALRRVHRGFVLFTLVAGILAGLLIVKVTNYLVSADSDGREETVALDSAMFREMQRDIRSFLEDWKRKDLKQNEGSR